MNNASRTLSFLVAFAATLLPLASASANQTDVLVEVNGQAITSADLEAMIVEAHRGGAMSAADVEGLIPRLLEKAIRDELILQDAVAMGMADDPSIEGPVRVKAIGRAVSLYGREHAPVQPVSEEQIQQFFDDHYHRIQLRQFSAETPEESLDALRRVQAGEITMGELAVNESRGHKAPRGGLHNDIYWADVDTMLRAASEDLEVGEYSDLFRYGDYWSFVRVESRTPPDQEDRPRFEAFIKGVLKAEEQERAWAEMVADRLGRVEITAHDPVLARVRADEELVYRGEFKFGSEEPVLSIDADHFISEQQFREAMSKIAMTMGTSTFDEIYVANLAEQKEFLALWWFAEQDGWFERPEVAEYYSDELDEVMIAVYLDEHIGQKIRLNREEYEQFYRDHQEDFRGEEQIRLSILTAEDEVTIRDADSRLAAGANFDYLRAEIEGREVASLAAPRWSTISGFSDAVIAAVNGMEVGDTSAPLPYGQQWMILRLDGRRPGEVRPIEEVDTSIRKALYYKEFAELMDEHLARLADASVIVRHEDRIQAWAERES